MIGPLSVGALLFNFLAASFAAWSLLFGAWTNHLLAGVAGLSACYYGIGLLAAWRARSDVAEVLALACLATSTHWDAIVYLWDLRPVASWRLLWPPAWYRFARRAFAVAAATEVIWRQLS